MSHKKTNFVCLGENCPNHCCGAYDGVSPNLKNTGTASFSEIILLPEDVERLRASGQEGLIVHKENGVSCIKTAEDGVCAALCNGRCTVYEARPAICRAYPLYIDMYSGICLLKECPGVNDETTLDDFQDNIPSLLNIYQYWIDYYRK